MGCVAQGPRVQLHTWHSHSPGPGSGPCPGEGSWQRRGCPVMTPAAAEPALLVAVPSSPFAGQGSQAGCLSPQGQPRVLQGPAVIQCHQDGAEPHAPLTASCVAALGRSTSPCCHGSVIDPSRRIPVPMLSLSYSRWVQGLLGSERGQEQPLRGTEQCACWVSVSWVPPSPCHPEAVGEPSGPSPEPPCPQDASPCVQPVGSHGPRWATPKPTHGAHGELPPCWGWEPGAGQG